MDLTRSEKHPDHLLVTLCGDEKEVFQGAFLEALSRGRRDGTTSGHENTKLLLPIVKFATNRIDGQKFAFPEIELTFVREALEAFADDDVTNAKADAVEEDTKTVPEHKNTAPSTREILGFFAVAVIEDFEAKLTEFQELERLQTEQEMTEDLKEIFENQEPRESLDQETSPSPTRRTTPIEAQQPSVPDLDNPGEDLSSEYAPEPAPRLKQLRPKPL